MNPYDVLAAEEREYQTLLKRKVSERVCEYHGFVWHALDQDEELRCIPCARERLDSMTAGPFPGESETCPSCGEPYVSKQRTPKDAVCFQCRYPEGE